MSRQISEGGESSRNRPISGLDRAIRSMLLCLILSVSTQGQSTAGDDEHALGLLHAGNDFATQGLHAEAIAKWSEAAVLRPDSNVPWNNIANALMNLDRQVTSAVCLRTLHAMPRADMGNGPIRMKR